MTDVMPIIFLSTFFADFDEPIHLLIQGKRCK
jgi:hypothetical protein